MIIKASQRSGARNLVNHLANTQDNDHVTLHEIRGLAGQLDAAFAKLSPKNRPLTLSVSMAGIVYQLIVAS